MAILKKWILLVVALWAGILSGWAKEPIKALVVTGQNNHNWQVSHLAIQQILENSGLFEVDFAISPAKGGDMSSFIVDFTPYQVVILDYNGDKWPEETNRRFMDYVENGGGVVVYHAANNSFPDWKEYNEICALGGWEGRDEHSGPYAYWKDNRLVKDDSPGIGGSHGAQREYLLTARHTQHPIMEGIPEQWLHAQDELYDRMRGPANIKDVLFTALALEEKGGSGREEPLVFTVDYGKARIFHLMLGHAGESLNNNPAMQCAGFQVLLLRGSEWAATGLVTQPIPKDFPSTSTVSYRSDYKK